MANPWNGKVILETFWWGCWNATYPHDWYTYIAKLAPRLAALGFDGIWTPPPCKDTNAEANMGYTPYDYYDLGQKDQRGDLWTRFGTMDAFLRLVAVAHANGLEVYPDIVLDHCSGGDPDPASPFQSGNQQFTSFHPNGYAGAGTGRWPRNWLDFHFNPQHWHAEGDWTPTATNSFGADFCYQGSCSDSGNASTNCAARSNARAWLTWLVRQTGVDGFRFDDVDGLSRRSRRRHPLQRHGRPHRILLPSASMSPAPRPPSTPGLPQTRNRCGTFDYPLRYALANMVQSGGFFDVGNLPSQQQQNRVKTVPFVSNHDTADNHISPSLDPDNPRLPLAYAVAMTVDGSPQLYYEDLFRNVSPWILSTTADAIPTRPWLVNLVWCHQKLAFKTGDYFVRYQDSQQLLILERGARAIVAINNDGANWHSAWISTAFFPNTRLHDYSGTCPGDLWTNADAWVVHQSAAAFLFRMGSGRHQRRLRAHAAPHRPAVRNGGRPRRQQRHLRLRWQRCPRHFSRSRRHLARRRFPGQYFCLRRRASAGRFPDADAWQRAHRCRPRPRDAHRPSRPPRQRSPGGSLHSRGPALERQRPARSPLHQSRLPRPCRVCALLRTTALPTISIEESARTPSGRSLPIN